MIDINDLIDDLDEDPEFDEIPVDIDEFITSGFLELDRNVPFVLSDYQREIILRSTQIYNLDTLIRLYGEEEGKRRYAYTENEIITMLGKGSGKDYMAMISCAFVVYKLLCLRNPATYFGMGDGSAIDIVNIAYNADQANRVFFKGFKQLVERSPWFQNNGFHATRGAVEFNKSVTVYSGHSDMESFEGYNAFFVVLDEISAFSGKNLDADADPAQAIYDMFENSVTSRFPEHGKLLLLSFPRNSKDFISKRYHEVIAEKNTIVRTHEYILNTDVPPDTPGNTFTIEWTEDHIIRYREDRVWALRRPSWEVNPTKNIEHYKRSFFRSKRVALTKFAAEPIDGAEGFFEDHEAIDAFSSSRNGVNNDTGVFEKWFTPLNEDTEYFIHVDLARKHDRAVVAMSHVTKWAREDFSGGLSDVLPYVHVDMVRWWTPTQSRQVDFADVRKFIMSLIHRGFFVRLVTFDQWQSDDMINYLNSAGVRAERLSVGLPQYSDLKLMIQERRVTAPEIVLLREELKQLELTKNGKNVDHPRSGSKDLADAVCGSVYNAAQHTTPPEDPHSLEVLTLEDIRRREAEDAEKQGVNPLLTRANLDDRVPDDVEFFLRMIGSNKK